MVTLEGNSTIGADTDSRLIIVDNCLVRKAKFQFRTFNSCYEVLYFIEDLVVSSSLRQVLPFSLHEDAILLFHPLFHPSLRDGYLKSISNNTLKLGSCKTTIMSTKG